MAGGQFLLPLFYVRKTAKRTLNEKGLILILVVSTLLTFVVIVKNLPANVAVNLDDRQLRNLFVPAVINDSNRFIHNERHQDAQKLPYLAKDMQQPKTKNQLEVQPPPGQIDSAAKREAELRREKVKSMTQFAWDSYKKYAWGKNELKPLSRIGHTAGIFGHAADLGASIVDAMDTLHIMGLKKEFNEGAEWIRDHFNINTDTYMSFFEINIRFIGGFLSVYALTNDKMYLDKAVQVADAFLPAFDTKSGISYSLFNPVSKTGKNYNWAPSACSILSEFGTLSLEFKYLSELTGNKIYQQKVEKIYEVLNNMPKSEGLYYNYVNPNTNSWCSNQASMAGLGDSFYEYLLKYWLFTNKNDSKIRDMYLETMKAIRSRLLAKSPGGYYYLGEYSGGFLVRKMGHLACFSGGLFALTSMYVDTLSADERNEYKRLAEEITRTCHESYMKTETHIGPESFSFQNNREVEPADAYYILRPEVVESYFYLWRMTKDPKYRDWAWDAVQALEKHCRTENGYSGLKDVRSANSNKDDVQQSFFFAETLKYLYLIFADDDLFPLDKYVFNTEAHPFPIKN